MTNSLMIKLKIAHSLTCHCIACTCIGIAIDWF